MNFFHCLTLTSVISTILLQSTPVWSVDKRKQEASNAPRKTARTSIHAAPSAQKAIESSSLTDLPAELLDLILQKLSLNEKVLTSQTGRDLNQAVIRSNRSLLLGCNCLNPNKLNRFFTKGNLFSQVETLDLGQTVLDPGLLTQLPNSLKSLTLKLDQNLLVQDASIAHLNRLESLVLFGNGGTHHPSFTINLPQSLKKIDIKNIYFKENIPLSGSFDNLQEFSLGRISSNWIEALSSITSLRRLSFQTDTLSNTDLNFLTQLKNLTHLEIRNAHLAFNDSSNVSQLRNLTHLELEEVNFDSPTLDALTSLPNLRSLSISTGRALKASDLEAISKFYSLEDFRFQNMEPDSEAEVISDAILDRFSRLPLQRLAIFDSVIPGWAKYFAQFENLKKLNLSYSSFDPVDLEQLAQSRSITELSIEGIGQILNQQNRRFKISSARELLPLLKMTQLVVLDLYNNQLDNTVIPIVSEMNHLEELFISSSGLTAEGRSELISRMPGTKIYFTNKDGFDSEFSEDGSSEDGSSEDGSSESGTSDENSSEMESSVQGLFDDSSVMDHIDLPPNLEDIPRSPIFEEYGNDVFEGFF